MLCAKRAAGLALLLCLAAPALGEPVLVTGHPASRSFLREVLSARGWSAFPSGDLPAGACWKAPNGERVINMDWDPPMASVAALSDHPEEVDRRGLLFSGGLTAQRPVRLQYYHLGALAGPSPQVDLWLTNPGAETARVHLIRAAGLPHKDYFPTGHGNNVAWFEAEARGEGEFLDLGPGESRVVYTQAMPDKLVISGTLGLTLVQGPPLQFGLLASPAASDPPSLNNLLKEGDVHSRGFYPVATQRMRRQHLVGSGETRVAIGALRQETFSGVRELRGDYGVLYELELDLVNQTNRKSPVQLVFNPRGGAATATFLLDGKVVEVARTEAMQEAPLATVMMEPHSRRKLRLRTIPEGASSYPIRIVVRE